MRFSSLGSETTTSLPRPGSHSLIRPCSLPTNVRLGGSPALRSVMSPWTPVFCHGFGCGRGLDAQHLLFSLSYFSTSNIEYFQYTQDQNFICASSNFPLACISEPTVRCYIMSLIYTPNTCF